MYRFLGLIFLSFLFINNSFAQQEVSPDSIDRGSNLQDTEVLLRQEFTGGGLIHSNGWGLNIRRSKNLTIAKKLSYELEVVSMKHPKEFKSVNPYFENSKGYIYGKLNTFTVARPGIGMQRVLFARQDRRGGSVEIRYHYFGGPSIGFAKPVYLEILVPTNVQYEFSLSTEKYDPDEHYIDNIYGKAPFSRGLDELKIYPGLYVKGGLSFEYATKVDKVRTIETGVVIDAYTKEVPIMALADNNQFFLSFYVGLNFGSKWY